MLLRIAGLPEAALAAAADFHARVLPQIIATQPGKDLLLVFPPAEHSHRAWRLAAVQALAREHAPLRVNAIESADEAGIAAAEAFLAKAPGVTGQYLPLDAEGASGAL